MGSAFWFTGQRKAGQGRGHRAFKRDKKQCQEKHEPMAMGSCYGLVFTVAVGNMKQ